MRTLAGDEAIVHANIKPIPIQLKETVLKSYARFTTRPTNHPLYLAIRRTARRPIRRHKTALHLHAESSNIKQAVTETITATRAPPSTSSSHTFRIAASKEEAIKWDTDNFCNGTMMYTDGSCYRNMVGASAVLYFDGIETDSLKYQLGTEREHTVFEGELVGIILGTHLATKHPILRTSINYSIDNQATRRSMQNNSRQPAQYLIDEIHRSTEELRRFLDDERRQDMAHRQRNDTDTTHNTTLSFTWWQGIWTQ